MTTASVNTDSDSRAKEAARDITRSKMDRSELDKKTKSDTDVSTFYLLLLFFIQKSNLTYIYNLIS